MANEVVVRTFLSIRKNNLVHVPPQSEYKADMTGQFGPAPGAILATDDGTDINLSDFTDPGWLDIYNQEPATADGGVTVSWGIYDPQTDRYYPIETLRPGKRTVIELDELFGGEFYPATGTGSLPAGQEYRNKLRVKAKDGAVAAVYVGIFER